MTRVLCLHGYGTSAAIMENQMLQIKTMAGDDWEFVFIDGEKECKRAPGLGALVPGPFLCYSDHFAPADIRRVHELVSETIEDDGPFDGVIGFSQGGSIALSYMLECENSGRPPPFKWACLFSTVAAFASDDDFRRDILQHLSSKERNELANHPQSNFSLFRNEQRLLCETTAKAFSGAKSGNFIALSTSESFWLEKDLSKVPRVIHPDLTTARISVPTVHVTGKKDSLEMVELSKLMEGLCNPKTMKVLQHSAGHDVARKQEDARPVLRAMQWAEQQSRQTFW